MNKEATARSAISAERAMKLALEHAKRDERHLNHAETRYWCRMYKDIAEKAVEALEKPDFWKGYIPEPDSTCSNALRIQGKAYPRTCKKCGLGPCISESVKPAQRKPLTDEQAYEIGAKGGEPSEAERLLFEAWMRGHCWAVIGEWDGKTYVHAHESSGFVHGGAMTTRQLWAAWRDRAALEAAHGIKENT